MGKTHRSAQRKISSSEKTLLEEIKSLKKLPESENKAHDIEEKGQQLFILRGSSTIVDDNGDTVTYESFEGKFVDGSKAVVVYKKYQGNIFWEDVALVTWMTDLEAEVFFGVNITGMSTDIFAPSGCGMADWSDGWITNDNGSFSQGTVSYDFFDEEQLIQDLGLSGAKGFFAGSRMNSYQEKAEDILRGQEIKIYKSSLGSSDIQIINSVSFPQSNISTNETETPSWAWVAVVLCVLLFITLLKK